MKWRVAIVALVCVLMCSYVFLPSGRFITPFPFSSQEISVQAYADYAAMRIIFVLLLVIVYSYHPCRFWLVMVLLFTGWLIDYFCTYNDPVIYLDMHGAHGDRPSGFFVPVSYTLFMLVSVGVTAVRALK